MTAPERRDEARMNVDDFSLGANYDGEVWLYHDACGWAEPLTEDSYQKVPLSSGIAQADSHLEEHEAAR